MKILLRLAWVAGLCFGGPGAFAQEHAAAVAHQAAPAFWMTIPFVALLLMIATGPLFFAKFWHKYYKWIAPALGAFVLGIYLFFLHDSHTPVHTLAEYVSFLSLLGALYLSTGGLLIQVDIRSRPLTNTVLLLIGAVLSNLVGTTGASMILIRPYMRLNRYRLEPYHIVFFIFVVSNVGGSLTPIGDPPLFLGFLKGVPFEWTLFNLIPEWLFAMTLILLAFWYYDSRPAKIRPGDTLQDTSKLRFSGKIIIRGKKSLIWLAIVVGAVFLDPNIFDWVPAIVTDDGSRISFLREIIQLAAGAGGYFFANKKNLVANEFSFEPIREVAFLFVGIFFTMMPALQLIASFATSETGQNFFTEHVMYWSSGLLSSFLDNAPTYLNFLSAATGKFGVNGNDPEAVKAFALGIPDAATTTYLRAISVACVFFGAMTYIGNGPNFMVRSIAQEGGVKMPGFFGYMTSYSLRILLPIFLLTWLVFYVWT